MAARRVYVGKNLTNAEAFKKLIAKAKKLPDFRGMKYNKKTGFAEVI